MITQKIHEVRRLAMKSQPLAPAAKEAGKQVALACTQPVNL